jgi:hypothetical protein
MRKAQIYCMFRCSVSSMFRKLQVQSYLSLILSHFRGLRWSGIRDCSWNSSAWCCVFSTAGFVLVPLHRYYIWEATSVQGSSSRRPEISMVSRHNPGNFGS